MASPSKKNFALTCSRGRSVAAAPATGRTSCTPRSFPEVSTCGKSGMKGLFSSPVAAKGIYRLFFPVFLADLLQVFEERVIVLDPALNLAQDVGRLSENALGIIWFVEAILTGRHEIMKTGRERRLLPPFISCLHVLMFSC